jgi:hypothetical protein
VLGKKCCHRFKSAAATTRRAKADACTAKIHLGQKTEIKSCRPAQGAPADGLRDEAAHLSRAGAKHAPSIMRKMAAKGTARMSEDSVSAQIYWRIHYSGGCYD